MKPLRLFFLCFFICVINFCEAQNTVYYKLFKIQRNNIVSSDVSGGQFITFIGDICYESDKDGIGVGHGKLNLNKNHSDDNFKIYYGNSYWGESATFKFKADLSALNVVTEDGEIFAYKRSVAPSNAKTCSLIRKGKTSNNTSGGYSTIVATTPNYARDNTNTESKAKSRNQPQTKVWHECSLCRGKKTIVRESNVATFGKDTQWYCNQCGRNVWRSSGHSHIACTQCRGQGGYYTNQ